MRRTRTPPAARLAALSAAVALLASASTPARAQNQAADCAVFEGLYQQSGLTAPWTKGRCCEFSKAYPDAPSFNCTAQMRVAEAILYQQGFTGPIPVQISSVSELQYLDLGTTNLSQAIPAGLAALPKLQTLHLDFNKFSGAVPDLHAAPALSELWLDHNDLSGNVDGLMPPKLTACSLTYQGSNRKLFTCDKQFPSICVQTAGSAIALGTAATCPAGTLGASNTDSSATVAAGAAGSPSSPSSSAAARPTGVIIGGAVIGVAAVVFGAIAIFLYRRRRSVGRSKSRRTRIVRPPVAPSGLGNLANPPDPSTATSSWSALSLTAKPDTTGFVKLDDPRDPYGSAVAEGAPAAGAARKASGRARGVGTSAVRVEQASQGVLAADV